MVKTTEQFNVDGLAHELRMQEMRGQRRRIELLQGGLAGNRDQQRYGPMCRHSVLLQYNCKRCDKIALDFARGAENKESPSVVRLIGI